MPKKTLQIKQFEGGINSYSSPRDIPDNALVDAEGISVDKKGIIRCSGEKEVYQLPDGTKIRTSYDANIEAGYGAFNFNSEHSNPSSTDELCPIGSYGVGFVNQSTTGNIQDEPSIGGFLESDGTALQVTAGSTTVPLKIHDGTTADSAAKGRWWLQSTDGADDFDSSDGDDDGWMIDDANGVIHAKTVDTTVSNKIAYYSVKEVMKDKGLGWYDGVTVQIRYYLKVVTAGDGLRLWAHRGLFPETDSATSLLRTTSGAYTEYVTFTKESNGNIAFQLKGNVAAEHKIMWVSVKLIPGKISSSFFLNQNWQSSNIYSVRDKTWKDNAVNAQIENIIPTEPNIPDWKHGKEAKPIFIAEEGILRISDSEWSNSYVNNRWYGAIDRSLFGWRDTDIVVAASQINTNHYGAIKEWHNGDAYIHPPTTTTHATLDSELITATDDKVFTSGLGGWIVYKDSGSASVAHDATDDELDITATDSGVGVKEGAQLPIANMGTLYLGKTYRVSVMIRSASGDLVNFQIGLGGTVSESFGVTATDNVVYHVDIKPVNTTGNLLIYSTSASTTNWTIDDVSVKEILVRDSHPGKVSHDNEEEGTSVTFGESTDGLGIHLGIDSNIGTNDVAGWLSSKGYHFYVSYLYDGEAGDMSSKQESDLLKLNSAAYFAEGDVTTANPKTHTLVMAITSKFYDTTEFLYLFNKRVTGARVYFEDLDEGNGIYNSLLDIDFEKGCRKAGDLVWTPWAMEGNSHEAVAECPASSAGATATTSNSFVFEEPFPEGGESLYEMNTGYKPQDMFFKYKTATRVGKRMYIGNIGEVHGAYKSSVVNINNDKIIFSPENKFDLFPSIENSLLQGNDGDEIIALQGFQDYLLIFKRKKLILVLVDDDNGKHEQVGEYSFYGVDHVDATIKTDFGVAWANNNGCYLFNGEKVLDLTKEKISSTLWSNFVSSVDYDGRAVVSCNYLPSKKQLVVFKSPKDTKGLSYICDLETKSWIKAPSSASRSIRTNVFNDEYGALCWFESQLNSSIVSVVTGTTFDTSGATDPVNSATSNVAPYCTMHFGSESYANSVSFVGALVNQAKVSKFKIALSRYNYNAMGSFTIHTDGTTNDGAGTTTGDDLVPWITTDSIIGIPPHNAELLSFSLNTTSDNETSGGGSDTSPPTDNGITNFINVVIGKINEGKSTHKWIASPLGLNGIKLTYDGAISVYADNAAGQGTTDSGKPSLKVPVFIFESDLSGSSDYYYLFNDGNSYTLKNDQDVDKSALGTPNGFIGLTENATNPPFYEGSMAWVNLCKKIKGTPATQGTEETTQVTEVSVQGISGSLASLSTPLSLTIGDKTINYTAGENLYEDGYTAYEEDDTWVQTDDSNQDVAISLRMKAKGNLDSTTYTVGTQVYDAEENDIAGANIYYFTVQGQAGVPFNVSGNQASTTSELQMFANRVSKLTSHPIKFTTKNFDFGDPSVRKKIYKVYVTFRSIDKDGDYGASYVTSRYMVNGEDMMNSKEFSSSSINYTPFQGFIIHENTKNIPTAVITDTAFAYNAATIELDTVVNIEKGDLLKVNSELLLVNSVNETTNVITVLRGYQSTQPTSGSVATDTTVYIFKKKSKYIAELKPSSSINNIYSFQLLFETTAGAPAYFEIDDITIVYRIKNVK